MKNIYLLLTISAFLIAPFSCKKIERLLAVATISVSTNKQAKGEVIDVAESNVEYGFCWGANPSPTTKTKVGNTSSPKTFETTLTNLQAGNTYYVRAYVTSEKGTEYGNDVKVTISGSSTVEYYWDDGTAETGWHYVAGSTGWIGNYFPLTTSGSIISIKLFFTLKDGHGNDQVLVNVFNSNRNIIGATNSFTPPTDNWAIVNGNGTVYSGPIYVMVYWNQTVSVTNYLGEDTNGPDVSMDLGWYCDSDNTWGKISSLSSGNPGIFLIHLTVQLTSGKTVTYTSHPSDFSTPSTMPMPTGLESMKTKTNQHD